jgi:hypothetical protein
MCTVCWRRAGSITARFAGHHLAYRHQCRSSAVDRHHESAQYCRTSVALGLRRERVRFNAPPQFMMRKLRWGAGRITESVRCCTHPDRRAGVAEYTSIDQQQIRLAQFLVRRALPVDVFTEQADRAVVITRRVDEIAGALQRGVDVGLRRLRDERPSQDNHDERRDMNSKSHVAPIR